MVLTDIYLQSELVQRLQTLLQTPQARIHIEGLSGSLPAVIGATVATSMQQCRHLFIAPSKEDAFYLLNDIETLLNDTQTDLEHKKVLLFPSSYRRPYTTEEVDNANVLQRAEVVRMLANGRTPILVTYPDALTENVVSVRTLTKNMLQLRRGDHFGMDQTIDTLQGYNFERVDFVSEPGQYAVRGGIIDLFSFANEQPYRIEYFDDEVDSLRAFDPVSQLSVRQLDEISIIPNLSNVQTTTVNEQVNLLHYFGSNDIVWVQGLMFASQTIDDGFHRAQLAYNNIKVSSAVEHVDPQILYSDANRFLHELLRTHIVEWGNQHFFSQAERLSLQSEPQPAFNKQFDLLSSSLQRYATEGYQNLLSVSTTQQKQRLGKLLAEHQSSELLAAPLMLDFTMHGGFIDHTHRILLYTDHQIFERYHKYSVRDLKQSREAMTLKELFELKPGDYITHIDYGVGRFAGLEKIDNNGKSQEVIRLVYKNNDTLYISIHGLHKISRYIGKEGTVPTLHRLGSSTWQTLKQKTKSQVKDIAKDLIALYAKRKATRGFAFSPDSYLQHELEASFIYEDTPDQQKATQDVKTDMEASAPMDRLVCGDVGFGKTEVAIRAAFKAACDSKQVAVLVPSTILAFQHYNTFCERLHDFPVRIDYLNRFRTTKQRNQILKDLAEGRIDILIGTHAITSSQVKFKDLGLLIIDEEQKFGVSIKERLRQMKVNVDCLTMTATPIPRTLQFSLMGARDLSVIQTPPPNRQPIQTELTSFNEETIRDAIMFEMSRGGQTLFVNNRVENLDRLADLVKRMVPDARVALAHGQMDGKLVEQTLLQFLDGSLDVLVATSIIENGIDIPNANTILINNAHQFGLSDLHQMRGRVGRSNTKAFCYLLVPSLTTMTADAQRRLRAIEEFSSIGSGFNLAMRDLDIRGAGNILGAEQSGFISEIGYDMYHKILNEALEELKESDFKELFTQEEETETCYVKECTIETDLSLLIPDNYVTSVSQRLLLYKQLNELSTEDELDQFSQEMTDRFGPLPEATRQLIRTISLRRKAREFGVERLVLKQDAMVLHFSAQENNPFYGSDNFMRTIRYATQHPSQTHISQTHNHLSLRCNGISSIDEALALFCALTGEAPSATAKA